MVVEQMLSERTLRLPSSTPLCPPHLPPSTSPLRPAHQPHRGARRPGHRVRVLHSPLPRLLRPQKPLVSAPPRPQ
eukprot:1193340-Prorocentrum_minimum.AAC.1